MKYYLVETPDGDQSVGYFCTPECITMLGDDVSMECDEMGHPIDFYDQEEEPITVPFDKLVTFEIEEGSEAWDKMQKSGPWDCENCRTVLVSEVKVEP